MTRKVFLLKSQINDNLDAVDPYLKKLEESGISGEIIQTIQFKYENIPLLFEFLSKPELFSGIVFLSPRCVKAVKESLNVHGVEKLNAKWNSLGVYVIGEATGKLVNIELQLPYKGDTSGNSQQLADLIINLHTSNTNVQDGDRPSDKPLLMPISDLHRDGIDKKLESNNMSLVKVIAYKTEPHKDLPINVNKLLQDEASEKLMVFFSPSGVDAVMKYIPQVYKNPSRVTYCAIGPTTCNAMQEHQLNPIVICSRPNPEELYKQVRSIFNIQ